MSKIVHKVSQVNNLKKVGYLFRLARQTHVRRVLSHVERIHVAHIYVRQVDMSVLLSFKHLIWGNIEMSFMSSY